MAKLLNVKNDFPVLVNNPNLSYLDTGATALKPYQVIKKLDEYYKEYGVNVNRGVYKLSYQATLEYIMFLNRALSRLEALLQYDSRII